MKSPTFISYAREDSEFALRLAGDLKARGVEVWVDRHRLQPGKLWDREVQQALTVCRELVVILSPDAVDTEEVMSEVFCQGSVF